MYPEGCRRSCWLIRFQAGLKEGHPGVFLLKIHTAHEFASTHPRFKLTNRNLTAVNSGWGCGWWGSALGFFVPNTRTPHDPPTVSMFFFVRKDHLKVLSDSIGSVYLNVDHLQCLTYFCIYHGMFYDCMFEQSEDCDCRATGKRYSKEYLQQILFNHNPFSTFPSNRFFSWEHQPVELVMLDWSFRLHHISRRPGQPGGSQVWFRAAVTISSTRPSRNRPSGPAIAATAKRPSPGADDNVEATNKRTWVFKVVTCRKFM